jgi:hypothetical protein
VGSAGRGARGYAIANIDVSARTFRTTSSTRARRRSIAA